MKMLVLHIKSYNLQAIPHSWQLLIQARNFTFPQYPSCVYYYLCSPVLRVHPQVLPSAESPLLVYSATTYLSVFHGLGFLRYPPYYRYTHNVGKKLHSQHLNLRLLHRRDIPSDNTTPLFSQLVARQVVLCETYTRNKPVGDRLAEVVSADLTRRISAT